MHALLFIALATVSAQSPATKTIGDVFHVGEEATWAFAADGVRLGQHVSRYLGQDELAGVKAHHFQGAFRLKDGVEVRSIADLWTDDLGHPIRFVQEALAGEAYSRVELDVAGAKSKARIVQGSSKREVTVDVDPQAYLLSNNFISHLEIVLALHPVGESGKRKLFSGSTLTGLDYTITANDKYSVSFAEGGTEEGVAYRDSLGEELRFGVLETPTRRHEARLTLVEVKSQKLVINRTKDPFVPITITPPGPRKAPDGIDAEEVKILRGDEVIAGAVTKRTGAKGRLPAVFFISGSGQQDRDGMSSGIDLGTHEVLDELTRRGFLVLRVDDRGTGESSPWPNSTSLGDLISDARACVEHLFSRADVDPKRIVLIGHSEGGETAPILAAERPDIAGIVLMAPPGRPILEIMMDQNRLVMEKQGIAGDELAKKLADVRVLLTRLSGDEAIDPSSLASDEERLALLTRPWLQSHAKQDPIATIKRVKCPVLILQGAKDFQVSPEKDAAALDAALRAAQHPDHQLKVFADLDHLFKKSPNKKSDIADYYTDRRVDETFLHELTVWLAERFGKKGG